MPPKKRFDKKNAISFQLVAKHQEAGEEYDPDAPKYVLEPIRLPSHVKTDADVIAALPKSFPKDMLATDEDFQSQTTYTRGVVDEDEVYLDESKLSAKQKKKMEENILKALNDDGGAREEGRMGAYFGTSGDYGEDDEDMDEDFDMEEAEAEALNEEDAAQNEALMKSKPSLSQKALYQYDYNKHFRPMTGAGTFFGPNGERSDPEAYDSIVPAIAHNDEDMREVEATEASKRLLSKHKGTVKSVISGLEIPVAPVGKGVKFTKDFMEALECGNENGFLDLEDNFYELAMASDVEEEEDGNDALDEEEEALIAQGMPAEMARAVAAAKLAHKRGDGEHGDHDGEYDDEDYEGYGDEDEDDEGEGYEEEEEEAAVAANTRVNRFGRPVQSRAAEDDEEERKVQALMAKLSKKQAKPAEAERHVHFNSGAGEQDKRLMQRFGGAAVDEEEAKVRALQEKLNKKKGDIRIKDVEELEEEEEEYQDEDEVVEMEEFEDEDYFEDEDEMHWDENTDEMSETMRLLQEMSLRVKSNKLPANATEDDIRQASEDRKFLELLEEYEQDDEDEEEENVPDQVSLNDPAVRKEITGYYADQRKQKKKMLEMTEAERAVVREHIKKRLVEYALEDEDMSKVAASIDAQFRKKSKEKWDVESICSTYSNVENIPTMIKEVRVKPSKTKIQISQGIHVPVGVLKKHREERAMQKAERQAAQAAALVAAVETPTSGESVAYIGDNRHEKAAIKKMEAAENEDAEEDEDDEYEYVMDTSVGRSKTETKEEKKARKAALRAEKAKKREQKKQLKDMFKKEKKVQDKMEVMNRSLNMAHKKL